MRCLSTLFVAFSAAALLTSCGAGGDNQGTEYAPNMYHSVAYEPYSQIVDEEAGRWVTSIEYPNGHAEFFNSNLYNPYHMNMREPAPHTVSRNKQGWLPYRLGKDSLAYAAANVKNPLDSSAAVIADGKVLYETYCDHCHGAKGKGDGKVAAGGVKIDVNGEEKERSTYNGVANLTSDALKGVSEGHIFHVITMGKGLMWAHGSQISPEDRWKIAKYVKTLQK
ncbi:c-type cytochrome [Chryseolinea lacunae]|uniref:Cytochrome c n=1 Tax=Chryseolinea lacunae TaxID=2801331 RepID=A0ABS1KJW2_9BACT|nr:cytochrome c [Chryseolinea lacunae]MBL0739754.1 cytochrome c [Chryseolinea lacunae]